jgi:TRAP-type C4-dicarboxylate transport system permease small subunit
VVAPDDPGPSPSPTEAPPPGELPTATARFADDSELVRGLRRFDRGLGLAEQGVLFALLIAVIVASIGNYVTFKITKQPLANSSEVIRYGVFALAMLGGAFATHHQRLLSLDLLSKFLGPRGRVLLRLVLAVFTVLMAAVAIWIGWKVRGVAAAEKSHAAIPISVPALFIPVGMALVAAHIVLQAAIDLDYLRRGKLPPEPEPGAV